MLHVLNAKEMKSADQTVINEFHVPSLVLMEKAALAVSGYVSDHFPTETKVGIVCGPGNNGADGIAVGRQLYDQGYAVYLYYACDPSKFSKDETEQKKMADAYSVPVTDDVTVLKDCDILIDAIFGTGLSREVEGEYALLIEDLNRMKGYKVAVDIPSGISSDDGSVLGTAFHADVTVTFAFYKTGQLLFPGRGYCGKVILCDIGISERAFQNKKPGYLALEEQDIFELLPKRKADSHKGSYGKVLVIAGSKNMAGAAALSARAVYRMGAGLVKIYSPECNRVILQTLLPEALLSTYEERFDESSLKDELDWADVVLIGPGLGTGTLQKKILTFAMEHAQMPMVVDADGLNLLSKDISLLKRPHMDLVLTPHLGEMSRLTDQPVSYIKQNLFQTAEEFSRENDVILALKDAVTVTAVPYMQSYINLSGNQGMATAGSGDVLSGIIAGLIATGTKASVAAPLGVYLHGKCGDLAKEKLGSASLIAGDLVTEIPNLFTSAT
ncbi:MAG: NAD(P)H-hydrate dehydratase [Lachnospiraceae bacterium]|nr:NAD(P)H-hydrate dehydratase [Lachnospiraceae bacterium]